MALVTHRIRYEIITEYETDITLPASVELEASDDEGDVGEMLAHNLIQANKPVGKQTGVRLNGYTSLLVTGERAGWWAILEDELCPTWGLVR